MRTTIAAIARALSIVGHPPVVVPPAVVALVSQSRIPSPASILLTICAVAGAVLLFSIWQVSRGRWRDTDASAPPERLKVSLHGSFAAFATSLLWPLNALYVVIGAVVAASVCWARIALGRHTVVEVVIGLLLGAAFGGCFRGILGTRA